MLEAARNARYELMLDACRKLGARTLLTAHHAGRSQAVPSSGIGCSCKTAIQQAHGRCSLTSLHPLPPLPSPTSLTPLPIA